MEAPPPSLVAAPAIEDDDDHDNVVDLSLTLAPISLPPPSSSSPSASSAAAAANSGGANGGGVRLFPCLFCNKKFLKSQALGGHQNAHKKERSVGWNAHLYTTPINAATYNATPTDQMQPISVSYSCHHQGYSNVAADGSSPGGGWRRAEGGGEKQQRQFDLNLRL